MTKKMVTATEPVGLEEANALLKSSKKGKLPVINAEGKVRCLNIHLTLLQAVCFGKCPPLPPPPRGCLRLAPCLSSLKFIFIACWYMCTHAVGFFSFPSKNLSPARSLLMLPHVLFRTDRLGPHDRWGDDIVDCTERAGLTSRTDGVMTHPRIDTHARTQTCRGIMIVWPVRSSWR